MSSTSRGRPAASGSRPTPSERKRPGSVPLGFSHPATDSLLVTKTGVTAGASSASPSTAPLAPSGPKSPASTSGPHMTDARRGLSGSGSRRSDLGSVTSTTSPLFQVRAISTYEPTGAGQSYGTRRRSEAGAVTTRSPLTDTANPSATQYGRRTASVNSRGDRRLNVSRARSPSGKSVSIASRTPASVHWAVEGAYRFTHRRSPAS